ncbi:MAG: GtrA family protein [bacterium]|nr:GtrA family protein [bacterium]MDE0670093.1 GtrA family protein [bacterium]
MDDAASASEAGRSDESAVSAAPLPVASATRALAALAGRCLKWRLLVGRRLEWRRLARFGAVSAVVTPITLVILWLLHGVAGWPGWQANLVAVSAGAVPAYLLNRSWVWRRSGRSRLWGEVLPFWTLAVAGGAGSTVAVNAASRWDHSGLLVLVNLGIYGALWVFKFVALDRLLWPSPAAPPRRRANRGKVRAN